MANEEKIARPISPPAADGVTEMNEVSKEFNRSLSISNSYAPVANIDGIQPSSDVADIAEDIPADKTEDQPTSDEPSKEPESKADRKFIAPKDFELLKVIGMGAFGKVLQVRNRHSSKIFAMKIISKRLIKRKGSYVENILAERNILHKIANHPFIVTMHASFQTREKLFIIMDFCAGGELFLKLGREGHFRERTAAFYLAEITLALEHLHSINVLHRDLKPENILLGSDGHLCLTDFGLAKDFTGSGDNDDERARTLCGTMEYMAPEMVARKWYGKGADYWSLGCIAYEMLSGLPPFSSKKGSKDLFKKIMNDRIRGWKPIFARMPDGASAASCKLLKGLLNRTPGKRLGAARGTMFELGGVGALKQQPFFAGLDWGKLELKEIDPPEDFSVDNDEDLRHFHDEFVNMNLPRSVKEMSKLDFLPRHCDSENFRGFSFIGDNFNLPERSASEQDHYWNNVDDDGQSLSECASSVFDDDFGEAPAPEPVPEKKKRPPRKKKKKQQQVPLETTNEGNEGNENKAADKKKKAGATVDLGKKSLPPSDGGEPDVSPDTHEQLPQPPEAKLLHENEMKNKPPANAPAKSLNPNAQAWGKQQTKPAPQASMPTQIVAPQTTQTKRTSAAPSYAPKPGTWASLAVKNAKPAPINKLLTTTTALASPRGPPKSQIQPSPLSSDWRTHVVSPQRKSPHHRPALTPKGAMVQSLGIPPPPIAQPEQNAWPSLGDFPPPPGSKAKESKQTKTKPVGPWGKAS
ncbi:hypothetical protein ACHAXR_006537 [Thalassiosira sp. AJA248-18]